MGWAVTPNFRLRPAHVGGLRRSGFAVGLQKILQLEGKTTSYDVAQRVVRGTDKAGRTFAYRLADDGFVDAVATPQGRVSRLRSDADGNLLELIEPSGQASQFTYDEQGAPTTFKRDGQTICRFTLNSDRTENHVVFWDGSRATAVFDAGGKPLELTNRNDATDRFTYDAQARLRTFADANGVVTSYSYGANGKLKRTRYADGHSQIIDYDGAGNVAGLRPNGDARLAIASTAQGRVAKIECPDESSYDFKYDEDGRVSEAVAPKASSKYVYGPSGELLEETNDAHSFKFEYDPTGLLLAIDYPDKSRVTFEYDLDKRLARVSDWSGAATSFRQELDDRSAATSWPNGLSMAATLTPNGKPLRTSTRNVRNGLPLYETLSTFDAQGRVASHADSEFGKRDYSYDSESQLLAVRAGTGDLLEWFSYDPAGNRQSFNGNSVAVGVGNRMLSTWNARCGYDAIGNLIDAEWNGKAWRYEYDARGQLVEADGPDGKIEFEYDAFGRRTLKRTATRTTEFVWCGEHLTREITKTDEGTHTRDYLYLPGTHTPFALRADNQIYYYHCDHQGTPHRLTDSAGQVVWSAEYSAFGQAHIRLAQVENPLRFPGQYYDAELGLSYNRFRYYNADFGRYITPDPVGLLGGANLYCYVGNDPLNKIDALGLWWKAALSVVVGVAVAAAIVVTAPVSAPILLVAAGAAVLGVSAGVGLDKALNIDHFCVPCAGWAFLKGFGEGAVATVAILGAMALFPEAATAIAVGGAAVGCYAILAEHLGWPLPAGDILSPSTWHLQSGPSFDEMTEDQKSASLGGLAGQTAGAVAGGRAVRAVAPGTRGGPNPETTQRTGDPTEVTTNRASERPYQHPPERYEVRPGEPVPTLDPNKGTYLWQVSPDGTVVLAPENQPGFGATSDNPGGRVVKHGDLNPGPDGANRGVNRAGGELRPVIGPDGQPTGDWIMDNSSSNSFARSDGTQSTPENLQASKQLLQESGMDTSNIQLQDWNGNSVPGD